MDFKIFLVVCVIFSAIAAAEHKGYGASKKLDPSSFLSDNYARVNADEQIFRRLEANENLIHQLLGRMEYLETREKEQRLEIHDLRNELALQKRRASLLETIVRQHTSKEKELKNQVTDGDQRIEDNDNQVGTVKNIRGNRIRRAENENPVAFFAGITSHVTHAGVNQTYVFDHAITNIGNAYNIHNGNFIAPVDGTYVFSVTLMSLYHNNAHARFFKNGQPITWMYVSGGEAGYDTTSQTLVLQLRKGDDVSVHNMDNDVSMAGNHYSTFAGFLLYETSSDSVIVGK